MIDSLDVDRDSLNKKISNLENHDRVPFETVFSAFFNCESEGLFIISIFDEWIADWSRLAQVGVGLTSS